MTVLVILHIHITKRVYVQQRLRSKAILSLFFFSFLFFAVFVLLVVSHSIRTILYIESEQPVDSRITDIDEQWPERENSDDAINLSHWTPLSNAFSVSQPSTENECDFSHSRSIESRFTVEKLCCYQNDKNFKRDKHLNVFI